MDGSVKKILMNWIFDISHIFLEKSEKNFNKNAKAKIHFRPAPCSNQVTQDP
jgi:hypothetical protein